MILQAHCNRCVTYCRVVPY